MDVIVAAQLPDPLPDGLIQAVESALQAAGFSPVISLAPEGLLVSDAATANTAINSYVGSAEQLAYNQGVVLTNLGQIYLGKFVAGFNYTGPDNVKRNFQIDPTSQFNIDVMANSALGSILNGEPWDPNTYFIASDNTQMVCSTPQLMRAFTLAAKVYVGGLILYNRFLKDQILAAQDMATLNAIDITAGWPAN